MKPATVLDELATAAVKRAQDLRGSTDLGNLYQEALLFEKRPLRDLRDKASLALGRLHP